MLVFLLLCLKEPIGTVSGISSCHSFAALFSFNSFIWPLKLNSLISSMSSRSPETSLITRNVLSHPSPFASVAVLNLLSVPFYFLNSTPFYFLNTVVFCYSLFLFHFFKFEVYAAWIWTEACKYCNSNLGKSQIISEFFIITFSIALGVKSKLAETLRRTFVATWHRVLRAVVFQLMIKTNKQTTNKTQQTPVPSICDTH